MAEPFTLQFRWLSGFLAPENGALSHDVVSNALTVAKSATLRGAPRLLDSLRLEGGDVATVDADFRLSLLAKLLHAQALSKPKEGLAKAPKHVFHGATPQ